MLPTWKPNVHVHIALSEVRTTAWTDRAAADPTLLVVDYMQEMIEAVIQCIDGLGVGAEVYRPRNRRDFRPAHHQYRCDHKDDERMLGLIEAGFGIHGTLQFL